MSLRIDRRFLTLAILYAASALGQQPASPLAAERALLADGKLADAEAALHSYLNVAPSSAEAHFLLGYVLFRDHKAKESLAEFTAGAKFQRPTAADLKIVASDYVMLGDYADADKWFSEVVTESPNDADAWYLLGRTKYNENEFVEAVSSFERALTLHPKYVEAENNLGLSWRELNDFNKAQVAFETAIDWQGASPTDAQPFLNLGTLLADRKDLDKAMPYLAKADALSPGNPKIHEELSDVYAAQKNLPKAQGELEQAIALAPNTSALHFKLGRILREEGLRDRALQEFDICTKLSSSHSSSETPNLLTPPPPSLR